MSNEITPTVDEMIHAATHHRDTQGSIFLHGLTSSNPTTVWWAIRGCGLKKVVESIPQLLEILGKPCVSLGKTDVRRIAALALSQMGLDSLINYVRAISQNRNALLREGVADTLGLIPDPRAVPILAEMLNDEDHSVLLWACLAISKFGNLGLTPLQGHLLRTTDQTKALYILDALSKIGTEEAQGIVVWYLDTTPFKEMRKHRDRFLQG